MSLYHAFRFISQYFVIFVLYTYFFHTSNSLFRSSPPWVFLLGSVLGICGGFAVSLLCRSLISIQLLCNFVGVTLQRGCSLVNLLRIFRASLSGSTYGGMLFSFAKALLTLIFHFKGTFTCSYHCFDHDSHIFNVLQLLQQLYLQQLYLRELCS